MGLLDDSAIFTTIVEQGGFSHAAKYLGLSNGMISQRIAKLEAKLGVSLIKRTTRRIELTPEGELFWQHAIRIQHEMEAAVSLIQSSAKRPKGTIRLSAPIYFGRRYLTEIISHFMKDFVNINVELYLSNSQVDPIEDKFDLVIRGAGYLEPNGLKDSSLQMKKLFQEKIGLYASIDYLNRFSPLKRIDDLPNHHVIFFSSHKIRNNKLTWVYDHKKRVEVISSFICNDIETCLALTINGNGIGRFTELNARDALFQKKLIPILPEINWGNYYLYAIYPQQKMLPKRTRLLLDFIEVYMRKLVNAAPIFLKQ